MPAVSFEHDRRQITIPVAIIAPGAPGFIRRAVGLIDTGASISGIARSIAEDLDLPRRGKSVIATPSGEQVMRMFLAEIGLYPEHDAVPFMFDDRFIVMGASAGARFEVLIGMDIIGRGDLSVRANGTGAFRW